MARPNRAATSFRIFRQAEGTRIRVFCFPYAGGAALAFQPWAAAFAPDIELRAAQYPGRQDRMTEPFPEDFDHLLDELWADLEDCLDLPFTLFGHSMGALLAFELACRCQELSRPPAHLFVSAAIPPQLALRPSPFAGLNPQEFRNAVERLFGPLPEMLSAHPQLSEMLLDLLRADLATLRTYQARPALAVPPLTCPVTAFAATYDAVVRPAQMLRWSEVTSGRFTCHQMPGRHLYIRDGWESVVAAMRAELHVLSRAGAKELS